MIEECDEGEHEGLAEIRRHEECEEEETSLSDFEIEAKDPLPNAKVFFSKDVKEFIRLVKYEFMLTCSNANDYNKFVNECNKRAGKNLT